MSILTFDGLKNKAFREIDRLSKSEKDLDELASIDHALNAAFTIYHLIQWKHEALNQGVKVKVHDYIMTTENQGLKVFHNIVTRNKHVSVTVKAYQGDTEPRLEADIFFLATQDGKMLTTEDHSPLVTEQSKVEVYFGSLLAIDVLRDALGEFI